MERSRRHKVGRASETGVVTLMAHTAAAAAAASQQESLPCSKRRCNKECYTEGKYTALWLSCIPGIRGGPRPARLLEASWLP